MAHYLLIKPDTTATIHLFKRVEAHCVTGNDNIIGTGNVKTYKF